MVYVDADSNLLPAELQDVFERVRQSADFMPAWQMEVGKGHAAQALCRMGPMKINLCGQGGVKKCKAAKSLRDGKAGDII